MVSVLIFDLKSEKFEIAILKTNYYFAKRARLKAKRARQARAVQHRKRFFVVAVQNIIDKRVKQKFDYFCFLDCFYSCEKRGVKK